MMGINNTKDNLISHVCAKWKMGLPYYIQFDIIVLKGTPCTNGSGH